MDPFAEFVRDLCAASVRFVLIGVWGVNHYACSGGTLFTTHDRDLFLPPDPDNLLSAWHVSETKGHSLSSGLDPLDQPRDAVLAQAVVDRRSLTTAKDDKGLQIDFTLVMAGFEFEDVWTHRREFMVDEQRIPVAALSHILASKERADREKDRLFLATHKEALRQMLGDSET